MSDWYTDHYPYVDEYGRTIWACCESQWSRCLHKASDAYSNVDQIDDDNESGK